MDNEIKTKAQQIIGFSDAVCEYEEEKQCSKDILKDINKLKMSVHEAFKEKSDDVIMGSLEKMNEYNIKYII